MDKTDLPSSPFLGGQIKLGLREESKKETLLEDIRSFALGLILYFYRRVFLLLSWLARFVFSGFTLTEQFKFWLSRRFVRRKGQLAFPFTHVTLVGISLSLLVVTAGLSGVIFQKPKQIISEVSPSILANKDILLTEKSGLIRDAVIIHKVMQGETIETIASMYFVPPVAIIYENKLSASDQKTFTLKVGEKLLIPPTEGTPYTVQRDTTVGELANLLGVDAQAIIDFTYPKLLTSGSSHLGVGDVVTIPPHLFNGVSLGSTTAPKGSCDYSNLSLAWPATGRSIIETFYEHVLGVGSSRAGVDIEAAYGASLYAAHDGTVARIGSPDGYNEGYGGSVFISIGGGFQIRYAHMSRPLTTLYVGQVVHTGDLVGYAGSTGFAFGPHLHFELLCNGDKVDAQPYLTPLPLSVR